jgi:trehalose 6-phosphate phosphatase
LLPAAGLHGWQRRRADGALAPVSEPAEILAPLRPVLAAYATARPGLLFEDKGGSLALHYRLAPYYGTAVRRLARRLATPESRLRVIEGRKVVELQPGGADKGTAVAAFLAEPVFAGHRPVYAGDDTTDEDAFHVVNRLGGLTVRVAEPERQSNASAAQYGVPSVAALHGWLAAVAERLSPDGADRALPAERQQSVTR